MTLKRIKKGLNQWFETKDNQKIFIGKKLEVYAPTFYEEHGLMSIEDTVYLPGIIRLVINDTYEAVMMFTNIIETKPYDIEKTTIDDQEQYILKYQKGDIFLTNINIVKSSEILYRLFVVFVSLGKIPNFITYEDIGNLFDNDKKVNGVNLKVGKEIFGLVFSNMYRDPDDPNIPYRNTDMKKKPVVIGLRNFIYGPQSTMARLIGAWFDDGLTGAALAEHPEYADYFIEKKMLS